jgi:hypothetical protein
VSLSLAKHMAETVGDPLPFSGQTMNKRLLERGWLVATNLDKNRKSIPVRRTIEGRTETVLHLKRAFLEKGRSGRLPSLPSLPTSGRVGRHGSVSGISPERSEEWRT